MHVGDWYNGVTPAASQPQTTAATPAAIRGSGNIAGSLSGGGSLEAEGHPVAILIVLLGLVLICYHLE